MEMKGAIFDMDGLIFDTERLFMEQLAVVMAERGYRLSREVYCKSLGLTGKSLEKLMLTVPSVAEATGPACPIGHKASVARWQTRRYRSVLRIMMPWAGS